MAGAVTFLGLVKPPGLVVEPVGAGERRQYCCLALPVWPPSGNADRQSREHVRCQSDALSLCRICFWLRVQVVPSARGCSADLLVRHVAVERHGRAVGGNRGRDLLRGAVGALLHQLGTMTGAQTAVTAAWVVVPLIV